VKKGACAALAACAAALLCACAVSNTYAGIPLAAGAADAELQSLARRAQAGDKQARLELGVRYEEGRGVVRDLERAERLYLMGFHG
jgi:TPR repeat protein